MKHHCRSSKQAGLLTPKFGAGGAAASVLILTSLLAAHPAAAQTTVIGFTPNAYGVTDNAADANLPAGASSYSLGFEFTANSPVFVTSLGYFNDPSFDPTAPFNTVSLSPEPTGTYSYADSHQVGLFQVVPGVGGAAETGLQIASATVTSAGAPSGDFLYTTLTAPVALVTGDQYVLAGVTGATDPYLFNIEDDTQSGAVGLTVDPAITYNQDRYAASSTLAFPGSTDPNSEPGFFGPNFQISPTLPVSAAPEPGEWSALSLAALGLGALVLRVRRRQTGASAE